MYKYFKNISTIEDAKKLYKQLAKENHPDLGGNIEIMQEINAEFDKLTENLQKGQDSTENIQEFTEFINKIINYINIDIEIIGTWLWIKGETYSIRAELKELGCKWSNTKKCWYKAPDDTKRHRASNKDLEDLKKKYGCQTIHSKKTDYLK